MKGAVHTTSAASWPTTSFFIPFSVLTGAKPVAYPAPNRCALPRLPLKNPKATINRSPIQKKPPDVAQTVQRAAIRSVIGFPAASGPVQVRFTSSADMHCRY
jgi:hypothetical protein